MSDDGAIGRWQNPGIHAKKSAWQSRWKNHLLLSLGVLFIFFSSMASAFNFDVLLMPGDLIEGHKEFTKDCASCHRKLEQDVQDQLCLDCHTHKNIADDIEHKKGFHGKSKDVGSKPCYQCHADHKGEQYNPILLDVDRFDHKLSDFELLGKHRELACTSCHKKGKKYAQAPGQCIDCHKDDDVHKGQLEEKCDTCHQSKDWKEIKFDHDKDTDFKLEGKHKDAACDTCHIAGRYKKTPKTCFSCHQINDVHGGDNGKKCENCHQSEKWEDIFFDHDKDTEFKITGLHKNVTCYSCHKEGLYQEQKRDTRCVACHQSRDVHRGLNGEKCSDCHSTSGWHKTRFDHSKDTKFAIKGKHEGLACISCHKGEDTSVKLDMQCISCHRDDDLHKGQQGENCQQCHSEEGWGKKVFFEHDITNFPLIGLHAVASCESCHASSAFKDVDKHCQQCHGDNDIHEDKLGKECAECHNPNGWRHWIFNHDEQTDYPLKGSHKGLDCHACHTQPRDEKNKLSKRCIACHQTDDRHRGKFGKNCERCHDEEDFAHILLGR